MAGAGAARPLVLPLPEVDAVTKGWTKRNSPWLLRAAAATKSTGRYRHNASMLNLGRIRVCEMGPLDRDRFTADRTATISVLGQPEKVASIHTQGRGDSKRIVARLESCGVDMQIRFYADAVSGSASYSVMGGAKYPILCVRMILFNQRVRSSFFFVTLLSFRLQGCARRARRSRAVARYRPSGRCAVLFRSCLCACLLGIDRFHTCACRACRWEEKKDLGFAAKWSSRAASSLSLRASHVPPLAFRFAHLLASVDAIWFRLRLLQACGVAYALWK